jgi:predicted nuclease of predicted toxin-antitoxin system
MTARLLVNENFPLPAVRELRERGVDVMAIIETAPAASDETVLAMAREQGRWLVTFDRDYGELVYSRQLLPPPAILYLRQGPYPPMRPATVLLDLIMEPAAVQGYFVVVGGQTVRRRPLP